EGMCKLCLQFVGIGIPIVLVVGQRAAKERIHAPVECSSSLTCRNIGTLVSRAIVAWNWEVDGIDHQQVVAVIADVTELKSYMARQLPRQCQVVLLHHGRLVVGIQESSGKAAECRNRCSCICR